MRAVILFLSSLVPRSRRKKKKFLSKNLGMMFLNNQITAYVVLRIMIYTLIKSKLTIFLFHDKVYFEIFNGKNGDDRVQKTIS